MNDVHIFHRTAEIRTGNLVNVPAYAVLLAPRDNCTCDSSLFPIIMSFAHLETHDQHWAVMVRKSFAHLETHDQH